MPERLSRYLARPDVSRHRARFLARRARYEVERRLLPRRLATERVIGFDDGLRVGVRLTEAIERSIYLYGVYEYRTAAAFCQLLRPGMRVLDVGAQIGQFALLASHRVGSDGLVVAFEPNPENHSRLQRNIERNGLSNIRAMDFALSDRDGLATLHIPLIEHSSGQGSLRAVGPVEREYQVTTKRLDDVLTQLVLPDVGLMKVDVEGLEAEVFRGAAETLRTSRPAVVFEVNDLYHDADHFSSPAMEVLREFGYTFHAINLSPGGGVGLSLLGAGEDPRDYREPWYALNLVALHRAAE